MTARLRGPRTGSRGVKIQPMPGIGFPPMSRPSSKSQGCSAWNSWNESLERTWAPTRSATRSTKASPRPMAPAGGDTSSPWATASSKMARSLGVDPVAEGGVDHHDHLGLGELGLEFPDGVVELLEARGGSAFGRDVRAVDDDVGRRHDCAQSTTRAVPGV